MNAAASSSTGFASDLIAHSIFHNIQVEDLDSVGNFVQLPSSTPQNTVLGVTSSVPYLATCSWVNYNLEAIFVISNQAASLLILKLPSIHQLAENHFTEGLNHLNKFRFHNFFIVVFCSKNTNV